ncbi:ribonuclease H-like domain-containing protein [Tanacetum coccineum]
MITHSQVGTFKPNSWFHGHTSHISPLPKSHSVALFDPHWRDAMYDEYNALIKNGTWILVPKPPNVNVVRSMWLFWHKYHADGSLSSPVVKPATIRTVLTLALTRNWPVHQLDVKNAFLNGDLSEIVYMYQPPGFVDSRYALRVGFTSSRCDSSLFIYQHGTEVAYLLRHSFSKEICYGVVGTTHMSNCNATRTPVDTESKLGSDGDPVSDSTLFRSLAGGLQYLTFTRPDISYVVQQICLHMHDHQEPHLVALKRVLRCVRGTLNFGLQLYASLTSSLVAYTGADWVGCPTTRRYTSRHCVFFGDNLLSWSSKRLHTLSRSNAEAEYRSVANVVVETAWLRNLLPDQTLDIDVHFVRDMVARGQVRVLHVPSSCQYADIFTKGLPSALFGKFRTGLSVRSSPAQTAGECLIWAIKGRLPVRVELDRRGIDLDSVLCPCCNNVVETCAHWSLVT